MVALAVVDAEGKAIFESADVPLLEGNRRRRWIGYSMRRCA